MGQTTYSYLSAIGVPGGIVDLAPYTIDTFLNEENTGVLKFGVGLVNGTKAGVQAKLPAAGATAADFIGIAVNNRTTEYDLEGKIHVLNGAAVGVMRYGRIYGRLATGAAPEYGEAVYLVAGGDEAGCFTEDSTGGVAVGAKFLSTANNGVAIIEILPATVNITVES